MKRWIITGLCAGLLVVPACRETRSDLITGTGNLLVTGDCHGWHVKADSGRLYELRNLSDDLKQHDLRVRFTLRERRDAVSACMVGPIVDIISMTRI